MEKIRLSEESAHRIRFSYYIRLIAKPITIIFKLILSIVGFFFDLIASSWRKIYMVLFDNRGYLSKVIIKLIGLVEMIILIIFLWEYFYNHHLMKSHILWMGAVALSTAGVFLILWLYHFFIGKDQMLKQYVQFTERYIEERMPHTIKIFGPPRVGKDTTGISMTSILSRRNRRVLPQIMQKIRKICYIFDFEKVNNACVIYQKYFCSSSKSKRRDAFLTLASSNTFKAFLLETFLKKIDYQELVQNYVESLENKVDFDCEYLFDDGISKRHFLDLLNEYMFLYVRCYIVKSFSMLNQPYIEDPESGGTGKIYSLYYESIASKPSTQKKEMLADGTLANVTYTEKVEAPILDWTIINLTENDTWFSNKDSEVVDLLKAYKIRDGKAFAGHFYNMLYYIQICHDASRMNKTLRELDAFYINILERTEFPGAVNRSAILSFFQKFIDRFLDKKRYKLDDASNRVIYKNQARIDYLERLYRATTNEKYLEEIEFIEKKEHKEPGRLYNFLSKLNMNLLSKIERYRKDNGVIRITATISDQATAPNLKEISIQSLSNRIRPFYHEAFKVDFYFRMKDSMGRYNHQYMSSVLEDRAMQSTLTMYNVMNWSKRMELSKEIMLSMGFPAGFKLYNISKQEVFDERFVPVDIPQKK